jgi:hypothetical protein
VVQTVPLPTAGPTAQDGSNPWADSRLLRAARQIYRNFFDSHPNLTQRPIGVALDRTSLRGKLVFGARPILLPHEKFIPLEHLQSDAA